MFSRYRHNMQRFRRLAAFKRTSLAAIQEAWAAEAGYNENGAGGNGFHRRGADSREEAFRDRNLTNGY